MKPIVITLGDCNGISPEITIKALNALNVDTEQIILAANSNIFRFYDEKFGIKLNKTFKIVEIPFDIKHLEPGMETIFSGEFAFKTLEAACNLAKQGKIGAIVTAPLSKRAMHIAGYNFDGQTEVLEYFLAHGGQKAEMLFTANSFRVFLLTRHVSIKSVSDILSKDLIIEKITRLNCALKKNFKISHPKIALCALNPHASENGLFGNEEKMVINPALASLKSLGIDVKGPFPADALFSRVNKSDPGFDCYVAEYHDQGLIPMKLLAGDKAVNTTIGLDIVRTSPAHGTAYDIAGKNKADASSMIAAIQSALNLSD